MSGGRWGGQWAGGAAHVKVICETGLSIFVPPPLLPLRTWRHNSLLAVRIYIPVVAPLAQLAADDIDFCYRKAKEKGNGGRGREERR